MNDGKYYINQSCCNTYIVSWLMFTRFDRVYQLNSIVIGVVCSKLAFVCKPCLYFTIQNWYWHIDFQWYLYNWYWQRYFNYTIDLLVLFYLPVFVETESLAVYWEWQSMKGSFIVHARTGLSLKVTAAAVTVVITCSPNATGVPDRTRCESVYALWKRPTQVLSFWQY